MESISGVTRDRLMGQSALQAYQADLPIGGTSPTPKDQAAVLTATLLRQSLIAGDDSLSERMRAEAVSIARTNIGEAALREGCSYQDHPADSPTDVMRVLAQQSSQAGRNNLAQHLLESLAEIETDPVGRGRILADRCRVSRRLNYLDLSSEQAHELLRVGRRVRNTELMALAHMLLGAVAEARGNRVEFRACISRTLRLAKAAGLRRLEASAHEGLGTSDAMLGRYGDAVGHYWRAYRLAEGRGHVARAVLGNLAQTLLYSGRPTEARNVAAMVLRDSPPLIGRFPVLGAFALASANLGDAEAVRWACAQVRQLAKSRHHARESAEAMIECAAALEAIGDLGPAGVLRRRGSAIAERYGFHALTFEEAMLSARRGARPEIHFHGAAADAAAEIVKMDVPRIPNDLALLAV
jgi:tetratricopeptide (TPR) repeat protein